MASGVPSLFLLLLLLLCLPTLLLGSSVISLPSLNSSSFFAEYIGTSKSDGAAKFTDVPVVPGITEFQFVLSFAADYTRYSPHTPTNGHFKVFWDSANLGPCQIDSIKTYQSNVKFYVSLGGTALDGQTVNFHPTTVESWVDNAVSSLTRIIECYIIDGIDIHYESFDNMSPATFAECIGRLVMTLKENGVIKFVSISPFPEVDEYYLALWKKYNTEIDHVNYKFYAYESTTTVDEFLEQYDDAAAKYGGGSKMLVGFSTDPNGGGLRPDKGFFEAAKTLKSEGKIRGIVVWNADYSKSTNGGFHYEEEAQSLLAT